MKHMIGYLLAKAEHNMFNNNADLNYLLDSINKKKSKRFLKIIYKICEIK